MVRPEANPDGILTYLYSTGLRKYQKMEVIPGQDEQQTNALDATFEKLGLPTPEELLEIQSIDNKAANSIFTYFRHIK